MNTDIHYRGFTIRRNPFTPLSYRIFNGLGLWAVVSTLEKAYRKIDEVLS